MPCDDRSDDEGLSEPQAAELLPFSRETLKQYRQKGCSPPYVELPTGRIRYWKSDVLEWLEQHSKTPSSSPPAGREEAA
jgi:predicted DNA-binding transcriptional regulator AlpA